MAHLLEVEEIMDPLGTIKDYSKNGIQDSEQEFCDNLLYTADQVKDPIYVSFYLSAVESRMNAREFSPTLKQAISKAYSRLLAKRR